MTIYAHASLDEKRRRSASSARRSAEAVAVNQPHGHGLRSVSAGESGGQGRGRTADLPLFRIKDHCPVLARLVFQPAQRATVTRHRLRCTNMNETRNETAEPVGVQPST